MGVSIVVFNGMNSANQHGLWVTDGTAAGTHELTGISGASSGGLFNRGKFSTPTLFRFARPILRYRFSASLGWVARFIFYNLLFVGLKASNHCAHAGPCPPS